MNVDSIQVPSQFQNWNKMDKAEQAKMEQKVDTFNTKLKASQKIVSKNKLEEADFLSLLVTQLKNQDPTKPMEDKEFIAQMAQFTSMKQMSNMSENIAKFTKGFSFTQSMDLVGKNVSWNTKHNGVMTGIVDHVEKQADETYLFSENGDKFTFDDIRSIKNNQSDKLTQNINIKA